MPTGNSSDSPDTEVISWTKKTGPLDFKAEWRVRGFGRKFEQLIKTLEKKINLKEIIFIRNKKIAESCRENTY